jgi:nucleotide-binding universal stress UspA family protein
MYSHILIPTDGSELAEKAVQHGLELAEAIKANVVILTVTEPFQVFTAEVAAIGDTPEDYKVRVAQQAANILAAAAAKAKARGVAVETLQVEHFSASDAIVETAASKGSDLIVMASHGRKGISAILLGSETAKVLTHCKVPVLVHR